MPKKSSGSKIKFATFKVQAASVLGGALIAEFLYLSIISSKQFLIWADLLVEQSSLWLMSLITGFIAALIGTYFWARGGFTETKKIAVSWRVDIWLSFVLGAGVVIYFGGVGHQKYENFSKYVAPQYTLALIIAFLSMALISLLHLMLRLVRRPKDRGSLFISDAEVKNAEDDLLDFSTRAKQFSERLYNDGSRESVVFGIDAPWGIGKSSFLNFCINYLEEAHGEKIVIYRFDPLKHEDPAVLHEKFINGLVKAIQSSIYIPEISSLMSRYSKVLKGKIGFRFFGLNFEPTSYSVEEAFEDLEDALEALDRKVLIIIDDLDRLDFGIVKDILFSIKKSFALPNLSYVLCYDTENIADLEDAPDDKEKVREFLEKFVNIKLSIFLSSSALANFVSENFSRVLGDNRQLDPVAVQKLLNAVDGIKDIYNSRKYYEYRPFLNDVRKLKRLINLIISLDIESTDFANTDVDKPDLIHLLLIYINYPNIFRKIYDTEMGEARGFFSLVSRYDEGFPSDLEGSQKYANSILYKEYIEPLSSEQKYLLKKIFEVPSRFEGLPNDEPTELARYTYACFNGRGGGNNLQRYLNLISNLSKPKKVGQYNFYVGVTNLFKGGGRLTEIFAKSEFSKGEKEIQEFWKVLVNGARELSPERAENAIDFLLESLPRHSLIESDEARIGIRAHLCRYLAVTLDRAGWGDKAGGRVDNSDNRVMEIASWIYGEKGRISILERLMAEERGVLGFYDVLLFRLQCSADRDSSLFNLNRALSLHSDPPGPVSGDVRAIAIGGLREMSQQIFAEFNSRYILPNLNFLKLVDELKLGDMAGEYVNELVAISKEQNWSEAKLVNMVDSTKSLIKSFCIYQLGNSLVSSGVGCGYFDEEGIANKSGIKNAVNEYLFAVCFDENVSEDGFAYFLDYLLLCFDITFEIRDEEHGFMYRPTLDQFLAVLDKERLSQYWLRNRDAILDAKYEIIAKNVYCSNYQTSYKEGLPQVYKVLDELIGFNDRRILVSERYG